MVTELPDVTCLTNGNTCRRVDFVVSLRSSSPLKLLQGQIDFGQTEARDRKVEVDIKLLQLQKALAEQSFIPMGMLGQPVVRDPKCLQLSLRQMPDLYNGYTWHPELFCCQNSPMADNYLALAIGHHGHHETKLPDRIRKLINLT